MSHDNKKKVHIEVEDGTQKVPSDPQESETDTLQTPEDLSSMSEEEMVEAAKRAGAEAAEAEIQEAQANDLVDLEARAVEAETKLEESQAALADAQDRVLRIQADWENFRRRTAQERIDERARATEKLVTNVLPVIDDLERAIEHTRSSASDEVTAQLADGVEAIMAKLLDVLVHEGVEQIDPQGEAFDPLEHQAVGREEDSSVYDETVAQVYQKGYRMGGKVIRPAMVTVAFGGEKRPEPEAEDETPPASTEPSES